MEITAEHVKELATLDGQNALVPMPTKYSSDSDPLWVIGVENKHYEGANTVFATSEQVAELAGNDDYDEDGELTDTAAERIADTLNQTPRDEAIASAKQMRRPEGYTAWEFSQLEKED